MALAGSLKLEGGKELERRLKSLGAKVQRKVLRGAIRKASRTMITAAKRRVPVDSGALKASLGTRIKVYKRSGTVVGIVGPRTKFKTKKASSETSSPAKYAHLVEAGTASHYVPCTKLPGGLIVPRKYLHPGARGVGFLEQAFDVTKSSALHAMISEVSRGINRYGTQGAR